MGQPHKHGGIMLSWANLPKHSIHPLGDSPRTGVVQTPHFKQASWKMTQFWSTSGGMWWQRLTSQSGWRSLRWEEGVHTAVLSSGLTWLSICNLPVTCRNAIMPLVQLRKGSIRKTRQFVDLGSAAMHATQHGTTHCADVERSWHQSPRIQGGFLSQHKNKPQAGTSVNSDTSQLTFSVNHINGANSLAARLLL